MTLPFLAKSICTSKCWPPENCGPWHWPGQDRNRSRCFCLLLHPFPPPAKWSKHMKSEYPGQALEPGLWYEIPALEGSSCI